MHPERQRPPSRPLYTPEERVRRDATVWTLVQGILAPVQFLVFLVSLGLVLRFVPEISGRYEALKEAHAARGIPVKLSRMLGPLIISTLKDADRIAEAIDARGIRGQ